MPRFASVAAVAVLAALALPAPAAAQARWSIAAAGTVTAALERNPGHWGPGAEVAVERRGRRWGFGAELGLHALGTEATRIENFDNQPGAVYQEDIRRILIRFNLAGRFYLGGGPAAPYLVAGAGGYDGRFRDRIAVFDPAGNRVPLYDFEGTGSDVKPGVNAGAGIRFRAGRARLGLEARWHGILDIADGGGLVSANHLTIAVVLGR